MLQVAQQADLTVGPLGIDQVLERVACVGGQGGRTPDLRSESSERGGRAAAEVAVRYESVSDSPIFLTATSSFVARFLAEQTTP